jgi:DNA-binding transcriptional ArsR family regulator
MTAGMQREARALGDPTRHRLFRYIADAPRPVGVGELTDYVRLNHNAVRQHLAVLKGAGLVTEEAEDRDRPGRPRLLYRLHPEVAGRWGTPGAYAWLAGLLSGAIRRGLDPRQVGRLEEHRKAAELAGTGEPADLLEQEMTRRGFRPARAGSAVGSRCSRAFCAGPRRVGRASCWPWPSSRLLPCLRSGQS